MAHDSESRVTITEVGLRDGLQNEESFVPTDEKIALAGLLADAGLRRIELTSFVSPRWIPQLRDHDIVASTTPRHAGVRYSALVPNVRGFHSAMAASLDEVAIFLSATDAHTRHNINKSVSEALDALGDVARLARDRGVRIRAYLSTAFGCPYDGAVDPGRVHELTLALLALGAYEVSLGDTIGVANPRQVRALLSALADDIPFERLALHMHDTRGTALANVLAGLDAGVRSFDSSFGGLGGCPYAPGASGNLATEDLVFMLEAMGFHTGVSLERLIVASERVQTLLNRALPSKVLAAELGARRRAAR